MDAFKWLEVVAPFYAAVGESIEELTRRSPADIDPDLLRLKREEIADKFEDAKSGLAKAADLAKKNAVADLASRGLLGSSLKELSQKSIDSKATEELGKMQREYNRAMERLAVLERNVSGREVNTNKPNQKPVFISHAHDDKELVDGFVDLLIAGANVKRDDIFCTSLEKMGVPPGENFVDFIKSQIQSPRIVLMVITLNYLQSRFCLCELGACWALSHKGVPLLVDPIGFEDLDGVVTATQAVKLFDPLAMSELKDNIAEQLHLSVNTPIWERKRDAFIAAFASQPTTQQFVVTPNEPVVEQPPEKPSVIDRLLRTIDYLEAEMAQMPQVNCGPDIHRLFAQALQRLKGLYVEINAQSIPLGQFPDAIKAVEKASTPQQLLMLDSIKWNANHAIKLLKEYYRFLMLDA
jgi:hypothetical protein